jgi:ATP-binding cassette subfamily B protein
MPPAETLPAGIRQRLSDLGLDEAKTDWSLASDLTAAGDFGERWLVLGDGRLLVISPGDDRPAIDLRLDQISQVKTESLVGCGALEAVVDGRTVELIRYSNAVATDFARAARRLEALVKRESPPEESPDESRRRCPRCRRRLEPGTNVCPACVSKAQVLRRLFGYTARHWRKATVIGTLMLVGSALGLAQPYLYKIGVDNVLVPRRGVALLGWLVLAWLGLHLAGVAISIWRGRVAAWLGARISFEIRGDVNGRLQRLSLSYFDKRQVGAVMARVTQDTGALHDFLVDGIQYFVVSVLELVGIGVVIFWLNWRLALLVLLPAPILALASRFIWQRMWRIFHRFWHSWSRLNSVLNSALSGVRVVKAFGQEEREISRFDERNEALFETSVRAERLWATYFPVMTTVTMIGSYLVWFVGGRDVIMGTMTIGSLMAYLGYLARFYGPLQMLSRITDWLSRALTATERIFEILDTQPEIADAPDAVAMPEMRGEIGFEKVTFGYDEHKPVLHDIDLQVAPGEMIGLAGHSGAGKSTLINLLCRFYGPNQGRVTIDGIDLRKIRLEDLRRHTGVVLQDPFLFSGTIAENIAYARPDSSREEIMRAAIAANAHEFIMKQPDGYDTEVGERGQRLSTGERQRVAIARAILHDPKLLILDEATASVDTETDKQIQDALAQLVRNRTTFAIAHRLSTLRNANRLLVLDHGKQAEVGTHEELMAKPDGVYRKLVEMQTELSRITAVGG